MKKVIDGKMYNTETATEISSAGNSLGRGDFRHYYETLYRTKKGAFFLYGEGGPMTKYGQPCGDMTEGGDGFFVLSNREALSWCERHEVEADTIAELFEVEEA